MKAADKIVVVLVGCLLVGGIYCGLQKSDTTNILVITKPVVERSSPIVTASEISITSAPTESGDGSIVLPFLGSVPCMLKDIVIRADAIAPKNQSWRFYYTKDGQFIGADFSEPEFSVKSDPKYDEEVNETRSQQIIGLPKTKCQTDFAALRRIVTDYGDFSGHSVKIMRIEMRRVIMRQADIHNESELFLITIWGKGIYPWPSGRGVSNAVRVVLNSSGKALWDENW